MTTVILGIGLAVLATLPFLVNKDWVLAVIFGTTMAILFPIWFYLEIPNTGVALFGTPGIAFLIGLLVCSVVSIFTSSEENRGWVFTPVVLLIFVFSYISNEDYFGSNDKSLASMIGNLDDKKKWTEGLQPIKAGHVRLSKRENAVDLAKTALGKFGALGSQYTLSGDHSTIQLLKNSSGQQEMWTVIPLDFASINVANEDGAAVKHYARVNGENLSMDPEVKELPKEHWLIYTPEATYDHNLYRHLRDNGYRSSEFLETALQLDDSEIPWWIIPTGKWVMGFTCFNLDQVLVVNPTTGEVLPYPFGKQPEWVDLAVPESWLMNALDRWGEYHNGYGNSMTWALVGGARLDLQKPDHINVIYGSDGNLQLVASMTSRNDGDTSIISYIFCDGKTGKLTVVETGGGKIESEILKVVNGDPRIEKFGLHGANPQPAHIAGILSSIIPVYTAQHMLNGIAIADITNPQTVGFGPTFDDALVDYEGKLSSRSNVQGAVSSEKKTATLRGVIDRFRQECTMSGCAYYVVITGQSHQFYAQSSLSPSLRISGPGDQVSIQYVDQGKYMIPMTAFENLSRPMSGTITEEAVRDQNSERAASAAAQKQ